MDILAIQAALKAQGFNPGPLDGVWGRMTMAAVAEFQKRHQLSIDGQVDSETERAIFAESPGVPDTSAYVWMEEARRLMGIREVKGPGSNPQLIRWADNLDIDYDDDDIAWCGLFTAHCIGATLPREPLPRNPLGARKWLNFGEPCEPVWGSVLVFWRVSKADWRGHVGFYNGEDSKSYHVLGGNQSDSVNIARVPKKRFLGARWPSTAKHLLSSRVFANRDSELSENEA